MNFVGILDREGETWGIPIPDLPGCVGAGATPEEAIADATAALRDVMAHMRGGGLAVARARSLAEILASGEVEPGEATVLIPLLLHSGRPVRADVTFDAGLLEAIDEAAAQWGLTRSAFRASAAREKIEAQK